MTSRHVDAIWAGSFFAGCVALAASQCGCAALAPAAAPATTLAVCVIGVVEKDWSNPSAMSADAVATCGALLPPLLSTLSTSTGDAGAPPTQAQRLAPIIDEAVKTVALAHESGT